MAKLVELFDIKEIRSGKVFLENADQYRIQIALAKRKMEGKGKARYALSLWRHEKDNSRGQQKYYRKVVCEWVGQQDPFLCSGKEMHGIYQRQGFWDEVTQSGVPYVQTTSLGSWTASEFSSRLEKISHWLLHSFDIVLPTQDEVGF